MKRTGHEERIVIDLDFLRDFVDLGRRFSVQERHLFLDYLFARTQKEIDRIRHAQRMESQPSPRSDACAVGRPFPDDTGTLIDLAERRETPQPD